MFFPICYNDNNNAMESNMPDRYGNIYYNVTKQFQVTAIVGRKPSNCYIGRARMLESVYENITVKPGDQIQILGGGDFLVTKDDKKVYHIVTEKTSAVETFGDRSYCSAHTRKQTPVDEFMDKLVETKIIVRPANGYLAAP